MDIQKAIDDAARGKLLPVYALHGSERMLVTRAIDAVRKATVGAGPRGLSEDHFEATEVRAAHVVDAARMLPMLSKWRLVLVRSAEAWKSDDLEALLGYVNNPSPSTALVLVATKFDARTKLGTALKKKGYLFDAEAPPERELGPWLEAEAARRGASFGPGAAASLVLAVGADLSALADALERLQLFAGERPISADDVDAVVAPLREASNFELPEAIAERDVPRALLLVHTLIKQRQAGLMVLAMVVRQVRLVARAREAQEKGEDLAAALRLPPFLVGRIAAQARKWSNPDLARALKACAQADLRLKSGGGRDRDARVLEELVLALAGGVPGALSAAG